MGTTPKVLSPRKFAYIWVKVLGVQLPKTSKHQISEPNPSLREQEKALKNIKTSNL